MTFGRSINKDLQEAGIELDGWYEMAQDRALWRAVVCHLAPPGETTYNDPPHPNRNQPAPQLTGHNPITPQVTASRRAHPGL